MILHNQQKNIVRSPARFKVIRAGRKGGKTALEVEVICYKAMTTVKKLNITKDKFASGRKVIYIAPTQSQARTIVWSALRTRLAGIGKFNESMLQVKVPNEDGEETTIMVGGWENRENYRGLTDVIHITVDETDTLRNFFSDWQEIFRPMFLDTGGTADFIGTPKKENPNLRRLEKLAETRDNYAVFHFTSKDNPHLSTTELAEMEKDYADNRDAYKQEVLAEYIENDGALFRYDCLIDVFTNTITKNNEKYLTVDVAGEGSDKTIFSYWNDLEEYRREEYQGLNNDEIIMKIRESAKQEQIPYSHIAVDGIGEGSGVAHSSLLPGIINYKSSYSPIKTDLDIVRLPNKGYTGEALVSDYKNLRSQCVFTLASKVNNHQIASRVDGKFKEIIIEELATYQDASQGDGKRMATKKEDVKELLGRSPDHSDTWIMRMYFEVRKSVVPETKINEKLQEVFERNAVAQEMNSCK
jgi:hypothetical protein